MTNAEILAERGARDRGLCPSARRLRPGARGRALGRRRQALSRLLRRPRGQQSGPLPSGGRRSDSRPGHDPAPCLERLLHRAGGGTGGAPLPALVRRARLSLQQRRRGERGGDEARPPLGQRARRPVRDPVDHRLLPRPHVRHAHRHRPGEVPPGLPAAAARHSTRRLRRRGGDGVGRARRDGRDPRRADPGRGRRQRAGARLLAAPPRPGRPARAPSHLRRGAVRHGCDGS